MVEPLTPAAAKKLVLEALATGSIIFDSHIRTRMAERGVTIVNVYAALRGGAYKPAEQEGGSWRYPLLTSTLKVVVAFRRLSPATVSVVTVIRHGR